MTVSVEPSPVAPAARNAPEPAVVLAHLDAVLTSETFHNADHARRLLRHIVEQTLAGQGDLLKETTLAIDVFGRDGSFDPRIDTIVRTEARRLRIRLDRFYSTEGIGLAVRIVLRRGGYVPSFEAIADIPSEAGHSAPPATWTWGGKLSRNTVLAGVAAIAVAVIVMTTIVRRFVAAGGPPPAANTIAVLPFANLGGSENEFFSDGITEELIESLGRIPQLRVVGRASVFQFKKQEIDIREVGRRLGVRYVLEGSVKHAGDRVRIATWLEDATTGYRMWSQTYDRQAQDALIIEQDIATSITTALNATLVQGVRQTVRPAVAIDPAAYELYLKGRYFWNRSNAADFRVAIDLFQRAIAKEPSYAPAHASLAACYIAFTTRSSMTMVSVLPLARAAAQKAVALDNSLGEAHTMLGQVYRLDGERSAAEMEYRRGIALSPSSPVAYRGFSLYYEYFGELDKALEQQAIARTLDPVSPFETQRLGHLLYFSGRYADAATEYQKALELEPNFGLAHLGLGMTLLANKQFSRGVEETQKGYDLLRDVRALSQLGYAHAVSGNSAAAAKILHDLKARARQDGFPAITVAQVEMGLGHTDEALNWLTQAINQREASTLLNDPVFAPLRPLPRYQQLLAQLKMAPANSSTAPQR